MHQMFAIMGLGTVELMIVAGVILLLFGSRLPKVMRSLGQGIVEFKRGVQGIEDDGPVSPVKYHAAKTPPPRTVTISRASSTRANPPPNSSGDRGGGAGPWRTSQSSSLEAGLGLTSSSRSKVCRVSDFVGVAMGGGTSVLTPGVTAGAEAGTSGAGSPKSASSALSPGATGGCAIWDFSGAGAAEGGSAKMTSSVCPASGVGDDRTPRAMSKSATNP